MIDYFISKTIAVGLPAINLLEERKNKQTIKAELFKSNRKTRRQMVPSGLEFDEDE